MITKNGIELNLKESNYIFNYHGLVFYFSSELYRAKFINGVEKFINEEETKIKLKYQLNIECKLYLAVSFYKRIEKRGFYIKSNGEVINSNVKFLVII